MILLILSAFLSILNILISNYLFELDECVINKGIAFGVIIDLTVLISIILLVLLITLGYINKGGVRYIFFSISLLGLSNLIVRLFLGGICDYISVLSLTFNIVDLGIVVLSIFGVIEVIYMNRKKRR